MLRISEQKPVPVFIWAVPNTDFAGYPANLKARYTGTGAGYLASYPMKPDTHHLPGNAAGFSTQYLNVYKKSDSGTGIV
jgi:hypothetical protein